MEIIIIGNSAASLNAVKSFRKYDKSSKITMISKEPGPAYSRVLLPYFLRNKLTYDKLFLVNDNFYQELNIYTCFGYEVVRIDAENHKVELDNGTILNYDKLLISSGATPVKPPIEGLEGPGIYHMWTLADALNLESYYQDGRRVLILGSGFVSLQAAWSAVKRGMKVNIYELASRIMPQVLDEKGAKVLEKNIIKCGINLKTNTCTEKIERNHDGTMTVYAKGLKPQIVDLIIVGTGVCPNLDFLKESKIKTDKGILVNERMETNLAGIYAAGDVAQGPTSFGGKNIIHALWPTAVEEGKVAGANMSGVEASYKGSLNMNVTEMFGITVASIGRFIEGDNDIAKEYYYPKNNRYIKLVYSGDIPVGGIVIGNSEDVELLGLMRPLIRFKKQPDKNTELNIKSIINNSKNKSL